MRVCMCVIRWLATHNSIQLHTTVCSYTQLYPVTHNSIHPKFLASQLYSLEELIYKNLKTNCVLNLRLTLLLLKVINW
jgi:hypothetical protein